jgi:hypothetical protein
MAWNNMQVHRMLVLRITLRARSPSILAFLLSLLRARFTLAGDAR